MLMGNRLFFGIILCIIFALPVTIMANLISFAEGYTVPGYPPYAYPPFPDSIQASIVSPNGSYTGRDIPLTVNISITYNIPTYPQQQAYELSVELVNCRYSLDGHEWKEVPFIKKTSEKSFGDPIWQQEIIVAYCIFETSLKNVSSGNHQMKVNAYDSAYGPSDSRVTQGNDKVNFTVVISSPFPVPSQSSESSPSVAPSSSPSPSTSPTLEPISTPKTTGFLGTNLPLEYGYAIVATVVIVGVLAATAIAIRRQKKVLV
jgi:hypothetical protein